MPKFVPRSAPLFTPMFAQPDAFARKALMAVKAAVDAAMPMTAAQRSDLPRACGDLSALLTSARGERTSSYWSSPRLTSAYLRYFLPWNLVRLAALFPNLPLGQAPAEPLVLDMGSGPLTLPLALWLARPDLRSLPVTIVASDTSPHPMELGRRIFDHLRSALAPASPWRIHTLRATVPMAPSKVRGKPWLIMSGNVLNEMEEKGRKTLPIEERLAELLDGMAQALLPEGRILAVEPGTRQGGRLITALRDVALEDGFSPLAPCPHAGVCPLTGRGVSAWCHATAPSNIIAESVPESLTKLSRVAGLGKDSVSLSFLLLAKGGNQTGQAAADPRAVRLISEPFPIPDYPGRARYACTADGLGLIPDCAFLPAGALGLAEPTPQKDAKSGARILRMVNA